MPQADNASGGGGGTVIAPKLARRLGVPMSVLSFLEEQFPEIRAMKTPRGRAYRAVDAAFLAGLIDALYRQGYPFREVEALARSSGRAAFVERGGALLGLDPRVVAQKPPSAPVPPDALVHTRSGETVTPGPAAGAGPEPREILRELMACVRILGAARQHETS